MHDGIVRICCCCCCCCCRRCYYLWLRSNPEHKTIIWNILHWKHISFSYLQSIPLLLVRVLRVKLLVWCLYTTSYFFLNTNHCYMKRLKADLARCCFSCMNIRRTSSWEKLAYRFLVPYTSTLIPYATSVIALFILA